MIRFLAELAFRSDNIIYPTPSIAYNKTYNIYEIDLNTPPTDSYWLDWGGQYDEFTGEQIFLYYEGFLERAQSITQLLATNLSYFITTGNICLMNIPKHTWLYADYQNESEVVMPFLSDCLTPANPSFNNLKGTLAPVRLERPNFTVKLSDNISGITLNQDFSLSLDNNDGYFDNEDIWNLFNTPVHLKKAIIENPQYEDFKIIRDGLVENTQISFNKIQLDVADRFRAMGEPICNVILQINYPNITISDKNLNKNIPIVYGRKQVKLLQLDNTRYIAAEKVTTLYAVYDKDGNVISGSSLASNGVITSTSNAYVADITGYTSNDICSIILDLTTRKAGIPDTSIRWNIEEREYYRNIAPKVNIELNNGDVKKAIQEVLKSDMAYFIQQNDGRFTIRKYGELYSSHDIKSWALTKKPEKTWDKSQENYFSSCIVNYNYINDDEYTSLLFTENENEAEDIYRRRIQKTFETDLITSSSADALAQLLSRRYTFMKQTIKVSLGIDTSSFELMDSVIFDMNINGRKFSNAYSFIIKEINPAQDTLVLEEMDIIDITGEYPGTISGDYIADYDNMYADTIDDQFTVELDGGII